MRPRLEKMLLLGVALFCTLLVFYNLTDFNSNFDFVQHALLMDTIIAGN